MKKQKSPRLHDIDRVIDDAKASSPKSGQRCRCCAVEVVRRLLLRYFERKDSGEEMPSLAYMTRVIEREFKVSKNSVYGHVNRCLQRNTSAAQR